MGNYRESKTQIGTEATKGTAVAASAIWRGPAAQIQDGRTLVFPEENIGSLPGKDRSMVTQLDATIAFPETEATFEQLPYVFGSAIEAESPVADGVGSGYVFTFDPPVDSSPDLTYIKSRTIETGDGEQAEEAEYCIVSDLVLKWKMGEAVKVSSNWFGRQAAQSTFTGALSLPSVEEILASKGKMYIDDAGGAIGSTQIAGQLLEGELRYTSGWVPRYNGDGNLYFTKAKFTKPEIELSVVFEHTTESIAEKEDWRDETARLMRLIWEGTALGTPGAYTYKTLQIDLAGKWESFEKLGDSNGISVLAGTLKVRDNDTADLYAQVIVVNELSALP